MHDLLDTEDADGAAERCWPDGFKEVIRTRIAQTFRRQVHDAEAFLSVYKTHYAGRFEDYDSFVSRLSEMVVIGAENGADKGFDEVYSSFQREAPLPEPRAPARYLWPEPVEDDAQRELHDRICAEYRDSHAYAHIHEDHYDEDVDFDTFLDRIAHVVVVGVMNGSDAMLENIYRAVLSRSPLPTPRRRPKRIY